MGARGPRKKLAAISRLEGNPSKRPIEAIGIEGQGEPFIPEHLSENAVGCIEVIRQSMPRGVYCAVDSFLLAAFAEAWALHKLATHTINEPGFQAVIALESGVQMQSQWIAVRNKQAQLMASLGDRLGLDPKARTALKLPAARQQRNKFEGLIGGMSAPTPSLRLSRN